MLAIDPTPFTWRACWRLCLPALILAFVVRLCFTISIPEAYYGSDSNSYWETADGLWNHHKFMMGQKRRGLYPLLLAASPIMPGNTPQFIAVLQHSLAIAALLGVGWVAGHLTRRRALWVPFITMCAAILPQPLYYEHEMIADSIIVQTFILAVALAFPIEKLRGRRLMWFLIAAAFIVAWKPHGRPLWAGLVLCAVVIAGNPLRWGWPSHAAIAAAIAIILGTGSGKQGSWLLLSSALPLMETEHGKWPAYRQALKPLVEEARTDIPNYPFRQGKFKKRINTRDPEAWTHSPEWLALLVSGSNEEFSKVMRTFALEAIFKHPITFAGFLLTKFGIVLAHEDIDAKHWPKRFWYEQDNRNRDRWTRDARQLELLYEMKEPEYNALVERRAKVDPLLEGDYLLPAHYLHWMNEDRPPGAEYKKLTFTWTGALGLLGLAWCFWPPNFRRTSPLWLPTFCYLGLVYIVGDSVRRYLIPVEWIGVIFVVLGIELIISLLLRLVRRPPPTPAMTPVPAQ